MNQTNIVHGGTIHRSRSDTVILAILDLPRHVNATDAVANIDIVFLDTHPPWSLPNATRCSRIRGVRRRRHFVEG